MFERLKEMFARNALLEQVDNLPDQAMSDLGISRGQLNSLARIPEKVQARMGKMAGRFGADIGTLQRDRGNYLDAIEACHHCGATKACAKALARSGANQAQPEELGFCPNAELYKDVAAVSV